MNLQLPLEGLPDGRLSDRTKIIQVLANFRHEWQKTVEGKSLIAVEAPIGLILSDIADRLQLNPQERHVLLGGKLMKEVDCVQEDRISVRLSS